MNIDIKKVYYGVLMAVIVGILGYYAYTHETFDNIVANNTEGVNKNCLEGHTDDGNGTCLSLDITKPDLNYKTISKTIYEAEANSKDDCTSFEKYHANDKTCYYECADEKECTAIENKINTELESWVDEESIKEANKNKTSENGKGITAENISTQFLISKGEKANFKYLPKESQGHTDYYFTIWNKIAALSPDDLSDKYIEEFDVYKNEKDDTIAFVDDMGGNGKWRIAINEPIYSKQSKREQYMTLIHELAHIISLNESQITRGTKCNTLQVEDGCLTKDSYLYKFYNNFYNKIWNKSEDNIQKYKEENEDKFNNTFVTDYAATNVVEDFAESFIYFVIKDDTHYAVPIGMEKSMLEKDKKIAFMNHDFLPNDTLMSNRKQMRAALSRELLKGL